MRGFLGDRPLLLGAVISLVWHLFWFFSVTITVGPSDSPRRRVSRTVSLGAVLDDTIFKTLIESRPQVTEAFYRQLSDFAPSPSEVEIPRLERSLSGDVVSVPFGKKFITTLKEFMDGDKPSPDFDMSGASGAYFGDAESLEGDVRRRGIISRPPRPRFPADLDSSLRGSETVIGFSVDPLGAVLGADTLVSSGNDAIDALWLDYVRGFRFTSLPEAVQKGRARLRFR